MTTKEKEMVELFIKFSYLQGIIHEQLFYAIRNKNYQEVILCYLIPNKVLGIAYHDR